MSRTTPTRNVVSRTGTTDISPLLTNPKKTGNAHASSQASVAAMNELSRSLPLKTQLSRRRVQQFAQTGSGSSEEITLSSPSKGEETSVDLVTTLRMAEIEAGSNGMDCQDEKECNCPCDCREEREQLRRQLDDLSIFKQMRSNLLSELEKSQKLMREQEGRYQEEITRLKKQLQAAQNETQKYIKQLRRRDSMDSTTASVSEYLGTSADSTTSNINTASNTLTAAAPNPARPLSGAAVNASGQSAPSGSNGATSRPATQANKHTADVERLFLQSNSEWERQKLIEELKFHEDTTRALQAQNDFLRQRVQNLSMEVDLSRGKDAEYAKRGVRQRKQIQELNGQTKSLERTLQQTLREAQVEKIKWENEHAAELSKARSEAAAYSSALVNQTKELRAMKKLAKMVVNERSEVERLLIDSLDQVKKEIKLQRDLEYKQAKALYQQRLSELALAGKTNVFGGKDSGRMRGVNDGTNGLPPSQPAEVSFDDLSLKDKERVLRLLFAKLNNIPVSTPGQSSLPPHSFDTSMPTEPTFTNTEGPEDAYRRGATFITDTQVDGQADLAGQTGEFVPDSIEQLLKSSSR